MLGSYLSLLRKDVAAEVKLVVTSNAGRFVADAEVLPHVSSLVTSIWGSTDGMSLPHLQLARWAQTTLVLPATANMLGKAANGIADDLASTVLLAAPRPVVFAPAMNESMWLAPAVRRNVARLREDGHYVIEPVAGTSLMAAISQAPDSGMGPTPELVLTHTMHVVLRQLRGAVSVVEHVG